MSDAPPELTNEAFARWLRAQRPPMQWFLTLEPEQQEQLAIIGEGYIAGVCVSIAQALIDPWIAAAGLDADTNPESEEVLARRLGVEGIQRIRERENAGRPASAGLTMGGLSARRQDQQQRRQRAKDAARTLMGRPPDGGVP